MRRIREDHPDFELRRAVVRVARKNYPCDDHMCAYVGEQVYRGDLYAFVSTGLRFCDTHFTPDDVTIQPRGSNG